MTTSSRQTRLTARSATQRLLYSTNMHSFVTSFPPPPPAEDICKEQRVYDYAKLGLPLNKVAHFVELNYYPDKELLVSTRAPLHSAQPIAAVDLATACRRQVG